ncbi:MAG: monooxygenase [Chroococcidiopsidaceae cyanobacterium CP_BM_ER_R8_30]|nr:monooxygenase [Chroococcidiopsidaceae cyanobacterium CP_BM_ER_R8_30]
MLTPTEQNPAKSNGRHALVIGGSITGLLAARVLTNHFDSVTLVERDCFPKQPISRQGVPQAIHVHVLLTQGQRILEQLFPGLEAELTAAGAPTVDWVADWAMFGAWGWMPRFSSGLIGRTCSRNLLEWSIRCRLAQSDRLQFLEGCHVAGLLTDANRSRVTGVRLHFRESQGFAGDGSGTADKGEGRGDGQPVPYKSRVDAIDPNRLDFHRAAQVAQSQPHELAADLVVDASGRNSSTPKWLIGLGYNPPQETVINSFLGYASRWYEQPEGFQADWKGVTVASKPPSERRGGVLYPIEGNRWVVTLGGIGRDYPPNNEAGFLDFARSLRSPIIYEAIKNAQPISPIYSYRGTENRLFHYEKLSRLPEGLVVVGDAVCAFNPVYGQGMTVAALGASILDECLHQQLPYGKSDLAGLTKRFQQQLAQVIATPWLMATGEDLCWSTTEGGQLDGMSRLMHEYMDKMLMPALDQPEILQTFAEVVHMLKPPTALFQPNILAQVLWQAISRVFRNRHYAVGDN